MNNTKYIFRFIFALIIFFFSPKIANSQNFVDNFDDPLISANQWITVGPQLFNSDGSFANWTFKDNMYGMTINNRGSQFNESVPSNTVWNDLWKNYIFEVDFILRDGPNPSYKPVDTNLVFRYIDHGKWYGIHGINDEKKLILQKAGQAWSSTPPERVFWYEYNVPYRIKIKVENDHIVISIRNKITDIETSLWDIIDSGTILDHGKPGLQASTGANPYCDVSFDNVVVTDLSPATPTSTPTPTPTPQTPIVFLPGLGGSFNFKEMFFEVNNPDGWGMTPGANVYTNLVKIFAGKDYFYTFYYDWRKPVMENAQKLNAYIKNTVKPWNSKVNLVGHSLGGLVARACVQKTENNCYADKLITVGSPHAGAVDAYPALEGGEIWRTGPIKFAYELFLRFNQKPGETRRDTLERIAPVLKDLLPNFNYLTKNGINLPPSSLFFQNSLLPQLADLTLLENKTNAIAGRNFSTVESIVLSDRSLIDKILGNWPDGKPVNKNFTLEGDNSVLGKSASLANPNIQNWTYNQDHGGIISQNEPLQKILAILDQDLSIPTENSLDAENYLVFFVHSPLKLSLLNLPSDSYIGDEMIIIPNPENKNYQLKAEGTGNGGYQLSVGQIFGESALWSDYFGGARIGETASFTFLINPQNPKTEPLIDNNGDSAKLFVSSLVGQLKEEVLKLSIGKSKQDLLIANLLLIRPNNPESSLNFLDLFRNLIAIYENINVISTEKANFFRNRCSVLAKYLENLAFLAPKKTKKNIAQNRISAAKKTQNSVKTKKLSKNSVFVYQEAEEKLRNAENNFAAGAYYQSNIFSLEAKNLFSESKIIK